MRRALAWGVYVLGPGTRPGRRGYGLGCRRAVGGVRRNRLGRGPVVDLAGIGIRLGVTPQDFMASIASVVGFGDRPQFPTVPADKKGPSDTETP